MGLPKEKTDHKFTYKDYSSWPEDERWELIDGIVHDMCAAPSSEHQWISSELARQVGPYLEHNLCKSFSAPFDVMLPLLL